MILPIDIEPKNSLFYNGAIILKKLKSNNNKKLYEFYEILQKDYKISFNLFLYSIDWLFLLKKIDINIKGEIFICF